MTLTVDEMSPGETYERSSTIMSLLSDLNRISLTESAVVKRLCVIDTETNGVNPESDRILQIAMVSCDLDLKVMDTFSTYVNPGEQAVADGHRAIVSEAPWRLKPAAGPRLSELCELLEQGLSSKQAAQLADFGLPCSVREDITMGQTVGMLSVLRGEEPDVPVAVSPFEIHQIPDDVLLGAKPWEDIAREVCSFIKHSVIIANEMSFDYGFIQSEMSRCGIAGWEPPGVVCSKDIAHILGVPADKSRMAKMAEAFGVVNTKEHDALADSVALVDILGHLFDIYLGNSEVPESLT